MNPLSLSFLGLTHSSFPFNSGLMTYLPQTNAIAAIQREQEYLQYLKQMQILKLQNQIQSSYTASQYQQNALCYSSFQHSPVETPKFANYDLNNAKSIFFAPHKETYSPQTYSLNSGRSLEINIQLEQKQDPALELKNQISYMLDFFVNKFETVSQEEVSEQRSLYASHPVLLKLFDKLTQRYSASGRSREDMIRSVLRGALRFLKDSYRTKFHLTAKAASIKLCEKYFKPDDMGDINFDDEDQVLSFLLPYKKNSRNKTPNTKFITEIFASDEFCQDYKSYLESFDVAFKEDNSKKIARFHEFLLKCVEDNAIEKVQNYKRLPWLKVWQEATKVVALELLDKKLMTSFNRKIQEKEMRKQQKCR